jgi:hypothetical protein
VGEEMILEGHALVEGVLPAGTVRKLTEKEMAVYRARFQLLSRGDPLGVSQTAQAPIVVDESSVRAFASRSGQSFARLDGAANFFLSVCRRFAWQSRAGWITRPPPAR